MFIRVHQNIKKFSEFYSHLIYVVSIWKKTKNAKKKDFWGVGFAWPPFLAALAALGLPWLLTHSRLCHCVGFKAFQTKPQPEKTWPNQQKENDKDKYKDKDNDNENDKYI